MLKETPCNVTVIVFNGRKDEVLLVKRRDVPMWVFPGGGQEKGERVEQTALREVLEETGLTVRIERLVAVYTPVNRLAVLTYLYECAVESGTLTTGSETKDLGFFPLHALPHPFFFVHRDWLADAEKNDPHPIQKPLKQVNYTNLFRYFCRHPVQVLRFALSRAGFPINSK